MIVSQKTYNENEYEKLGTQNFAIVKNSTYQIQIKPEFSIPPMTPRYQDF